MSGITFLFSDETTEISDIIKSNWNKTEVLHKDLKPVENTMRLSIPYDVDLFNKLKAETGDLIPASVSDENNTTIFTGYVRNTFSYSKRQRNQPMSLELVTAGYKLDVNTNEYHSWEEEELGTIINDLTALAGITTDITEETVIPVFFIDENVNIKSALNQLLSEYGYTYTFNAAGEMELYELFEECPASPETIFNGQNCLAEIKAKKNERKYGGAEITWHEIKEITNEKIYEEENITIPETTYFHNAETVYLEYDSDKGKPIKITSASPAVSWGSSALPFTFTNYPKRAAVSMVNDSSSDKNILQFVIKGSGYVQSDPLIEKTTLTEGKQNFKFTCETLSTQAEAQSLAENIANYYRYSLFQFTVQSKTNAEIGDFVTVTDEGFGTTKGRIIQKDTNYQTGVFTYIIESVSEYESAIVEDSYAQKKYENRLSGEQGFTGATGGKQEYQFAWNYNVDTPPVDSEVYPTPPIGTRSVKDRWYDAPPEDVPAEAYLWSRTRYVEGDEPTYALRYKGTWDALNNNPQISDATGTAGDFYRVSISGTRDLGSGSTSWTAGKQITHNGTKWEQSDFDTEGLLGYTPANNNLVPNEASASNQLSDKNFVNSSIATNTANFLGTNTTATTEADFLTWANALQNKTNNDYVFWQTTDTNGNTVYKRYKYNGSSWVFEYNLNNSSFTASQWATINSGLGSGDKTKIDAIPTFPLSVADGGTGQTTLNASANALINSLSTGDSDPQDNDYYVSQYAGGGTSITDFSRRPVSKLWNYIKGKIQQVALVIGSTTSAIAETLYGSLSIKNSSGTETLKIEQDGTVNGKNIPRFGTFYTSNTYSSGYVLIAQANSIASSVNHDVSMEGTVYVDSAGDTSISDFFIYARANGTTLNSSYFNCIGRKTDTDLYATYEIVDTVIKIRLYAKINGNWQRVNTKINYVGGIDVSAILSNYSSYITFPNEVYTTLQLGTQITKNTSIIGIATKATQDESGNNIKASYASSLEVSGNNLVLKNKNNTSLSTITVPYAMNAEGLSGNTWTECTITPQSSSEIGSSVYDTSHLKAYYNASLKTLAFKGYYGGEFGDYNFVKHLFIVTLPIASNFTVTEKICSLSVAMEGYTSVGVHACIETVANTKQVKVYMGSGDGHNSYKYYFGNCYIF